MLVGQDAPAAGRQEFRMHSPGERHKVLPELFRWVREASRSCG